MGNKKKQTNEFDNYFDDDFEVVYEDPEDLGSYLSEDSSDNSDDYDDYDGYDGDTDYYDDYDDDYYDDDYNSNGRDSKKEKAQRQTGSGFQKIQEEKASRTAQCRKNRLQILLRPALTRLKN